MSTLSASGGSPLSTASRRIARLTAVRDELRREVEGLEGKLAEAPSLPEEVDGEGGSAPQHAAMPGLEALVGAKSSDRQRRALTEKASATGAGLFGAVPSSVRVRPRGDGLVEYSFDVVVSPPPSPHGAIPRGAAAWTASFKLQVRPAASPGTFPRIEAMELQCPGAAMWPELAAAMDRAQRLRDPGLATSTLRSYAAQHAEVRTARDGRAHSARRMTRPGPQRARVFSRLESRFGATLAAQAPRGAAHSSTLVARCGGGREGSEAIALLLHWQVSVDDLGRATSAVSLHPRAATADPPAVISWLSDRFQSVVGVVGVEKGAEAVLELLESAAVRRGVTVSRDESGPDRGVAGARSGAGWEEEEEEEEEDRVGQGRAQKRLRKR